MYNYPPAKGTKEQRLLERAVELIDNARVTGPDWTEDYDEWLHVAKDRLHEIEKEQTADYTV